MTIRSTLPFLLLLALLSPLAHAAPASQSQTPADDAILAKLPPLFGNHTAWTQNIATRPVDSKSAAYLAAIGLTRGLHPDFGNGDYGIPFNIIPAGTKAVPVTFQYAAESDPGPYPIPPNPFIEGSPHSPNGDGDGDRHLLLIDPANHLLYELWHAAKTSTGWTAGSGAIFDLTQPPHRPIGWTSADAAGLPIFPGLARWDEATSPAGIRHALRFTASHTCRAFIPPATHFAPYHPTPDSPPMGLRVRLKKSFDISRFPPQARAILAALQTYGMILADNGSDWFISGTNDARWDADDLSTLRRIHGSDMEVIDAGMPEPQRPQ